MLADCFDIPIKQRCHLISGQPYSFASFVNYNRNRDLSVAGFKENNLIAIHFRAPHQSIGHMHVQFDTRLSAELYGCRPAGARTCLRALSDGRCEYTIHLADTYHWGPPYRLTLPVYLLLYFIRYRTHVLYLFSSIFDELRTWRRDRQPRPINRTPSTSCIPKAIQQTASKYVDSVVRRVYCAMSIFTMRRPRPPHKKLHNLFPISVHSLLAKRDYQCRSPFHMGFRNAPYHR